MSLNAPASPKRLSALELTFPSLEALGYSSDEDDERDPGPYAVSSRGRMYRRGSSTSSKSATSPNGNSRPTSPVRERSESRPRKRRTSATLPAAKERPGRKRLSSFAEYGDRPAPTSLAILAGLISGSARIIDRAYAEQGIPVPDIDDPGLPKSKYAKEQKELKVSNEVCAPWAIELICNELIQRRLDLQSDRSLHRGMSPDGWHRAETGGDVCRSSICSKCPMQAFAAVANDSGLPV